MEFEASKLQDTKENYIEGRNAVLEAYRSGKTIDKLFVLDGCQDGPVRTIVREERILLRILQEILLIRLSEQNVQFH